MSRRLEQLCAIVLALAACRAEPARTEAPAKLQAADRALRRELPGRLVAIGDLHGDVAALRRVLRLAALIDAQERWIGGTTTLVQTGDRLDRGDTEPEILTLLRRLQLEAKAAGGEVLLLSGNHELMNGRGELSYATADGLADFGGREGRAATFRPGGPEALLHAEGPVIAQRGDTLFVHGGILPAHVVYGLARINDETRRWWRGEGPWPGVLDAPDGPVWTRLLSSGTPPPEACAALGEVLQATGAKRLVVGHTIQKTGPTSACDGRVWRIDVGLSSHYGGAPAALELSGDAAKVLTAP